MADVTDAEKTPVTIITGFLGAGKTTLVNHILKGDHGKLIAVIENEFGAVSIDDALVGENMKEKEDVITMDNGCVCCTVRGDLVRALLTLKDRAKKFDHVIIETTGLADPAPVAFTFFINPEIADAYRIDSILCLADAKHVGIHLEEEKPDGAVNEAVQQVAFADRILLNKIDLVSEAELAEVVDTVKSINAVAEVIKTTNSVIDLDRVLGVDSFSIEKTLEVDPDFLDDEEGHAQAEAAEAAAAAGGAADPGHGHSHDGGKTECHEDHGDAKHGHGHGHGTGEPAPKKAKKKRHDLTGVSSVGILAEGELDFGAVNGFMMNLLQENALNIYRSKGVMKFKDQGNTKFVFQGVHEQINFGPSNVEWGPDEKVVNKMVFIGRNLNRNKLSSDTVSEAVTSILKKSTEKKRNFTETIELQVALKNYDPQKDKRFSGSIDVPNTPREKFVVCLLGTEKDCGDAAKAGIDTRTVEDLKKMNKNKKLVKKLANAYDAFLASATLIRKIPRLLGPGLNKAGKFPSVYNAGEDIAQKVLSLKQSVKFQLKSKKTTCMGVAIANVTMKEEQATANIVLAVNFLVSLLPKNWQNIKRLYIKSTMGPSHRIYGF